MPKERLSMRKIREVLRLRYELGRSNREIARSCDIGSSTVSDYIKRAGMAGLTWSFQTITVTHSLSVPFIHPQPRRAAPA